MAKLLPDQWPKEDLARYLALQNGIDPQTGKRLETQRSAVSSKAMIAGTNHPLAIHAGLEVLKLSGSAADAVGATSLAQIALSAGAAISFAGILTAVYFEASSGKVHTLNAAYNTVQNEREPLTIPRPGEHGGRTALVPGFMAGIQALHDRFGKLPFSSIFGPAIWIADTGVSTNRVLASWLSSQKNFITRLPETRRVFTRSDGELYKPGDLFQQPELAATLKKMATQGSAYMYTGDWARHFVDAVRREGGKMTLDDLAAYRALWTEPIRMPYRDYEVVALGNPNAGTSAAVALKIAEAADLRKYGHYSRSPEAFYYLIQFSRVASAFAVLPASRMKRYFPDIDPSPQSLLTMETAEKLWARIRRPDWPETMRDLDIGKPGPSHSAGVLAVDEQGNVASILHSSSGNLWGATGIFVDGISIPDSAALQQGTIARVGPGVRLTEYTNPMLVLKGGTPILASSAIGVGLHETTLQNLVNVLDFGMNPKTSVDQPNSRGRYIGMGINGPSKPEYEKEAIAEADFPQEVLDGIRARGQALKIVSKYDQPGYWIGIQIEPHTRKLMGAGSPLLPTLVEGY